MIITHRGAFCFRDRPNGRAATASPRGKLIAATPATAAPALFSISRRVILLSVILLISGFPLFVVW